ncbi:hypothetical protein U8P73_36285 (plasmid) [Rhizobium beringeri]|uniref:hypothetical protein n=1 Tax=Rhizobium beringeri TaxID=3019934 RepID=UPI002DDCF038|nr:hypothetical protein [Rhizobium beringeri]WSG93610.1 hypothetical protein U8P73_36285 [Rhizobium beringeri]
MSRTNRRTTDATRFTVKIRDVVMEADTPRHAALKTAEVIAMMRTIDIIDVVDDAGLTHEVGLTQAEIEQVIASAAAKMGRMP